MAQLLGTSRLTLLQSEAWSKWASGAASSLRNHLGANVYSNSDQRMHMDYPNHYLTHPPPWDSPEAVEAILYFDDVAQYGGATRVVPHGGPADEAYAWPYVQMPGVGGHEWLNDKEATEKYFRSAAPETARFRARLYEREVPLAYKPGTLLLYRFDTWHRGSPLAADAPAARRVLNLVYARSDVRHITPWNCRLAVPGEGAVGDISRAAEFGFARAMYFGAEDQLNQASVAQKSSLGVPPPGSAYWTREMQAAVAARFPNGDWGAYGKG